MLNIEFFEKTNIKTDGIDLDKSYSSFDSSTLNLIIELYLKKDVDIKCEYCTSNNLTIRGSKIS